MLCTVPFLSFNLRYSIRCCGGWPRHSTLCIADFSFDAIRTEMGQVGRCNREWAEGRYVCVWYGTGEGVCTCAATYDAPYKAEGYRCLYDACYYQYSLLAAKSVVTPRRMKLASKQLKQGRVHVLVCRLSESQVCRTGASA